MGTPQIIMIALFAVSGTITLLNHNEDRGKYNFWVWMVSLALHTGLLYWGGFFG